MVHLPFAPQCVPQLGQTILDLAQRLRSEPVDVEQLLPRPDEQFAERSDVRLLEQVAGALIDVQIDERDGEFLLVAGDRLRNRNAKRVLGEAEERWLAVQSELESIGEP